MNDLNPVPLISLATSYWNSATLIAAVKLGVFDALKRAKRRAKSLKLLRQMRRSKHS